MSSGYTAQEKQWVKKNYGSEFHLLASYGLSIYKDGDREEGKAIMQGLVKCDSSNSGGSQATGQADKVRLTLSRYLE